MVCQKLVLNIEGDRAAALQLEGIKQSTDIIGLHGVCLTSSMNIQIKLSWIYNAIQHYLSGHYDHYKEQMLHSLGSY
jgi:hypothetical protein